MKIRERGDGKQLTNSAFSLQAFIPAVSPRIVRFDFSRFSLACEVYTKKQASDWLTPANQLSV